MPLINGTGRRLKNVNNGSENKDTQRYEGKQPYRKELDFIFHEDSLNTNSALLHITNKPLLIGASGLMDDEVIHVMRYAGAGSSAYAPVTGKFLRITTGFSNIMLGEPGVYQLVMSDFSMVGRVIVDKKQGDDNNFYDWLKAILPLI